MFVTFMRVSYSDPSLPEQIPYNVRSEHVSAVEQHSTKTAKCLLTVIGERSRVLVLGTLGEVTQKLEQAEITNVETRISPPGDVL